MAHGNKAHRHFFFLLLFFPLTLSAQQSQWQWSSRMGSALNDINNRPEDVFDLQADSTGNVYVCGQTMGEFAYFDTIHYQGPQSMNGFLAKYDCEGELKWMRYAAGDVTDYAKKMALGNSGDIYLTGKVVGTFPPFQLHYGMVGTDTVPDNYVGLYLSRWDTAGNVLWVFYASNLASFPYGLGRDSQNRVFLVFKAGQTGEFAPGFPVDQSRFYLARFSSAGTLEMLREIGQGAFLRMLDAITDAAGNTYICGNYTDDSNGFQDTVRIGGQLLSTRPGGSDTEAFLAKFAPNGDMIWLRTGGGKSFDGFVEVDINAQGDVVVGGTATRVGGLDIPTFGALQVNPIAGANFPIVLMYDTQGTEQWIAYGYHPSVGPTGDGVAVTEDGTVFLSGQASTGSIFGTDTLQQGMFNDPFVVQLDSAGNFTRLHPMPGTGFTNLARVLEVGPNGNFWVGGLYAGTMSLPGLSPITSRGGRSDGFVARYGIAACEDTTTTVGLADGLMGRRALRLWPNPASTELHLDWELGGQVAVDLDLMDLQGRLLLRRSGMSPTWQGSLPLEGLTPGLYLLRLHRAGATVATRRLMVR